MRCGFLAGAKIEDEQADGIDYCDGNLLRREIASVLIIEACGPLGLSHTPAIFFRGLLVVSITLHISD